MDLRFLAGSRRRNLHLAMAAIGLLGTGVVALLGRSQIEIGLSLYGAAFQAVAGGVMHRFGAVLTPSGVTLRGWNTRYFPWSEVASIEATTFLGARRAEVRLTSGSKVRTWAPYDDFLLTDLKFDQKVAAMQAWHARHLPDELGEDADELRPPGDAGGHAGLIRR